MASTIASYPRDKVHKAHHKSRKLSKGEISNSSCQQLIRDDTVPSKVFNKTPASLATDKHRAATYYTAVAAIDFGTTYSGYAYAFMKDPTNIHLMNQRSMRTRRGYGTQQPTALLLNERGEFHSFGYAAQEYYHDLDEREASKWLYFEKFKMELHSRQHLHEGMELEAANGYRLPAMFVFAHALRYFKDECQDEISEQSATFITAKDIQWVITVPAIWRPSARQFMRRAAIEAGMVSPSSPRQLIIALEPEAASVYCRNLQLQDCIHHPMMTNGHSSPSSFTPSPSTGAPKCSSLSSHSSGSSHSSPEHYHHSTFGSGYSSPEAMHSKIAADIFPGVKYLVADCGGGTVDLTIHQMEENGQLKELYKATGGAWGSIGVDGQFEMTLVSMFGEQFIEDFIRKKPVSWLELMNSFEAKKRGFDLSKRSGSNISLPFAFIDHFRKVTHRTVEDAILSYGDENVQWSSQGMLRLLPPAMKNLFEPVVTVIVKHIEHILDHPEARNVEYLFLVGGFAESPVLRQAMKENFSHRLQVIIPQDVSLTILKGAVMFGLDPSLIRVRRSRVTYGVGCLHRFDPDIHPPEKKVVKDDKEMCTDVFDTFVFAGQAIPHGHSITRCYNPARSAIKSTVITLFATENESVQFITDQGVSKVAELKLEMPDTTGGRARELRMTMMFGDTEISVQAIDCTSGQTASAHINFLCR